MLEYYKSLALEGETALIVLQKPQLVNNEYQYHNDGAVKCTWPAFLPKRKLNEGKAWYGNTGSFILDRMGEKISAAAANCTHCLCLVLDDIGTKSKYPPLPPTWIMETSPSNFQWGYAYKEDGQPLCGEQSAALTAIAAAGYTDPGATNPVRNFRLPGSVNLKPDKDGFVARLVEFHPEREFTLPQILAALQVIPGEASTAKTFNVTLEDDGSDDVLAWLASAGHLLTKTNSAGWAGVACPRADRHTDGNPEARYMPATRSFVCMHGHCDDLDTEWFLDWVWEHGGPNANAGLRSDLLAATMTAALAKLAPAPALQAQATQVLAEVERRQGGRLEKEELHARWAYVEPDDAYFDLLERREITRKAFNATYRHLDCRRGKVRIEASVWFDEHREAKGGMILRGVTYAAGDTALVHHSGDVFGNGWIDARPQGITGNVDLWLAHCARMVPDPDELAHVWDVMAFKVQHPRVKINHAILHAGNGRSGKDLMWAPFFWAIRGASDSNVNLVNNNTLSSVWGYDLLSEVIILNELRQTAAVDRRELENRLKPIIAAPPMYLPVNRKGLHPVNVVNRVFVMAFSNFRDAIALPSDDGRWFVLWSDAPLLPQAEAKPIWDWYENGGFHAIAAWLMSRDVSKFQPGAAPMWTEAKALLCEQSLSTAESWILERIQHGAEFKSGIVCGPFHALIDILQGQCPPGIKLVQNALFHALAEAGWRDHGRLMSAELTSKKRIFARKGFDHLSKSELRRMAEDVPALSAVPNMPKEKAPVGA